MSLIATDLDPEAETTVRDALSQRFSGAKILVQDVQVMHAGLPSKRHGN